MSGISPAADLCRPAVPRGATGLAWAGLLLRTVRGACLLWVFLLAGCAQLPTLQGRSQSVALQHTQDTALGREFVPLARQHPGKSGVIALADGPAAFATRLWLAQMAQRSLDVQYYIWHDDIAGIMLFDALRRAAQRGVRVRLLLDDNEAGNLDGILAALAAQPNIQVRLFNPFLHRHWRFLDYLTDFSRLNRRMHNKSFTADNQATIIGGRNIGDEYFGAGQDFLFVDLDVMAIGPVVKAVSHDFDRYWASASAYPVGRILPPAAPGAAAVLAAHAAQLRKEPVGRAYLRTLAHLPLPEELRSHHPPFEWAVTHMVSDDPAKGLGQAPADEMMPAKLDSILGTPKHEMQLVSPYFVPTAGGARYFEDLARKGVKVTILTNSLEATDVAVVHAGYAKWRKPLLRAGVKIYEMKREFSGPQPRYRNLTGRSASSLHAKTISVDRSRIFIGSFNFDPRSAKLNTEMGFVIDSADMARAIPEALGGSVLVRAYRVRLSPQGKLQWVEHKGKKIIVYDTEPGTSFWLRLGVSTLSVLPIDWML
ncbi:phospholipase D family protein [Candidimonas humi]|uniref:Phospholipase D family protein n=1 Tax=Candidimonas humi TaxID=683355 RepID=A0ABV8P5K7_9BURK|nr:phospholipase D family protein [Candidimonas humi]MBV6307297.1 phospholipase D family protein [Candidimonas humi]